MDLTCTNNHPGISLPDDTKIPPGLRCGTCSLPMMPVNLMKPFMKLKEWNEQIFPALSVASDSAEQEMERISNEKRKPGDPPREGNMGGAMMKIMGVMHHVMMVEQLKKLIVIPEEIAAQDHGHSVK